MSQEDETDLDPPAPIEPEPIIPEIFAEMAEGLAIHGFAGQK